jgi:DNA-binding MarR family transcriptional regulator
MPETGPPSDEWFSFLLVRLGTYLAAGFAEALEPLGIEPRHFGLLNRIATHEGASQQTLGQLLDLHPTRMVFAIDELEDRGFVERRRNPSDRRTNALFLTRDGRRLLTRGREVAARRAADLGAGLTVAQRKELTRLLQRVADAQGLPAEGLPMGASRRPARRAGAATT